MIEWHKSTWIYQGGNIISREKPSIFIAYICWYIDTINAIAAIKVSHRLQTRLIFCSIYNHNNYHVWCTVFMNATILVITYLILSWMKHTLYHPMALSAFTWSWRGLCMCHKILLVLAPLMKEKIIICVDWEVFRICLLL